MEYEAIRAVASAAVRKAEAEAMNAEFGLDPEVTRNGVRGYRPDDIDPDSVPLAIDLVTFWIWMDPGAGDAEEAAVKAIEYTGE